LEQILLLVLQVLLIIILVKQLSSNVRMPPFGKSSATSQSKTLENGQGRLEENENRESPVREETPLLDSERCETGTDSVTGGRQTTTPRSKGRRSLAIDSKPLPGADRLDTPETGK